MRILINLLPIEGQDGAIAVYREDDGSETRERITAEQAAEFRHIAEERFGGKVPS